jgi:polar amino acid transport system substrate-binding protein
MKRAYLNYKIFFILLFFITTLTHASKLEKVSLQLQWKYQFQFAGYIMAKEKDFYKDAGLDVDIKEWHNGISMVDEVMQNRSEYAVVRPTSLIDIAHGKQLLYLAAIYQSSPLILLTDKSKNIRSVKDIKNKRMMTTGDLNSDISLLSMMFSQGLRLDDLKILQPSFNPISLLNGKTDLMTSYISNEPYLLKQLGGDPVIFNPKNYGFDFYNDIVVTSKKHYQTKPQEVKSFRQATLKGWEYAFAHIPETVDIIYKKYNTLNKSKDALLYEAQELKKLAYYKSDKIGKIEKSKLEKMYDIYKLFGLIYKDINLDDVIYSGMKEHVTLTQEEREYLDKKQNITMCIDPNWMPFEHFDKNGNYEGMSADYYKLFEKKLSTNFRVIHTTTWAESIAFAKERKCDIFSLAMQTPTRKKYMNFTTPYLKIPLVITTKLDVAFVNDIEDLYGKKIGISQGYAFVEILKDRYPFLNIVEVKDIDDGLDRVNSGELYAFIGTLASVGHKFQTKYSGELKIAGKMKEDWQLGIGVRNDDQTLLIILQKAVESITPDQQREILNKWVSIKYEKGVDYSIVWKLLIIFVLAAIIGYYFYRKQKLLKERLEESNKKLAQAYGELEEVAVTDKLTKLYNRHKLDVVLQNEKHRVDRYDGTFGIVILDIDHFKLINDMYGHHAGDLVLENLGKILKENSRASDTIGRWGGEEFMIIAPNLNEEYIESFANNLKSTIKEYRFDDKYSITVSIGVSVYKPTENIEKTVARADEALYMSKNKGRDTVTFK